MLGVNQLDFINYTTALKGNYRKGCHKLQAILSTTVHATEFAKNKGGVAVVLGVPVDSPDKNSDTLLALLFASSVADQAVETFLTCFYTFDSLDDLLADEDTCLAITDDPVQFRATSGSSPAIGKLVATLAGLPCADYDDMDDIASSSTAMTAVASSSTAMTAVASSSTAMTAVASSPVAMAAIWESDTAIQAVEDNATAWTTFTGASSEVMGKTVAILADLNPEDYDDMDDIASSSTAMTAVASSPVAMAAVAASAVAMAAVAASAVAMTAIGASSVALSALNSSPLIVKYNPTSGNAWATGTVNGSGIFVKVISFQPNINTVSIDGGTAQSITSGALYAKAYTTKFAVYYVPYGVADYGIYYIPC